MAAKMVVAQGLLMPTVHQTKSVGSVCVLVESMIYLANAVSYFVLLRR